MREHNIKSRSTYFHFRTVYTGLPLMFNKLIKMKKPELIRNELPTSGKKDQYAFIY